MNPIPEKVNGVAGESDINDSNVVYLILFQVFQNQKRMNLTRYIQTNDKDIFCRVTKLRDACILLARSRPYREHPTDWVVRHLERAGLQVVDVATFPRKYNYGKIKL